MYLKCRRNPAFFFVLLSYINPLQLRNNPNGLLSRLAANKRVGLEGAADARALRAAENLAA